MNRNLKIYLIIVAVIIGLLALLEVNKKPLIDWQKSYDVKSKSPFGLFVFRQESNALFGKKLKEIRDSPYQFYSKDSLAPASNILVIQDELDKQSWSKILNQVGRGSDALFIGEKLPAGLRDTLQLQTYVVYKQETTQLSFTDPQRKGILKVDKLPSFMRISKINPETTQILGKISYENSEGIEADFVKIHVGKGNVFIHLEPLFITNYYLLQKGNDNYAQQVFSYLPSNRETLWFTRAESKSRNGSPLSFILGEAPLRYAWYIFLAGLLVFIIFSAKRKQRIVPIIRPLENTSVDFVRTIGNLYLNEGDVQNMAEKKVTYFLNKLRSELLMDCSQLDEEFAKKLRVKTNASAQDIEKAIRYISGILNKTLVVSESDLMEINEILNRIYK